MPQKIWRYTALDLPFDWKRLVQDAALDHSERIVRKEPGPGSLDARGLDYRVLSRRAVDKHLPWLTDWYLGPGLTQARMRDPEVHTMSGAASLNVNLLAGVGGTYEPHHDSMSHTMVLFASDQSSDDGGALWVKMGEQETRVYPKTGRVVLFDSSRMLHMVEPLLRDVLRVTVVAQYVVGGGKARDPRLDDYLYEEKD